MPFGWDARPLEAEQKLANLAYTVDNTFEQLRTAWRVGNKLKHSQFLAFRFNWTHGYKSILKLGSGYWTVYSDRIGSMGDARHAWSVWDDYLVRHDHVPKGLLTRTLPPDPFPDDVVDTLDARTAQAMDSFQTSFGVSPPEDYLIAATINRNKGWRRPMPLPDFIKWGGK